MLALLRELANDPASPDAQVSRSEATSGAAGLTARNALAASQASLESSCLPLTAPTRYDSLRRLGKDLNRTASSAARFIRRWIHTPVHTTLPEIKALMEQQAQRYGVYLAGALATLILSVAYMTWRDTMVWSRNTPLRSQASLAAILPSHSLTQDNAADVPQVSMPAPSSSSLHRSTTLATAASTDSAPPHRDSILKPASSLEPEAAFGEHLAQTQLSPAGGFQELTTAEGFLNGKGATPRDTTQAADWLWKAVRKQNAKAALLLSELYLKGDGVDKSCEQARLLLGVAARKGISGAAERIRDLPAFGCQ